MTSSRLAQITLHGAVAIFVLSGTGLVWSQPTGVSDVVARVKYFDDRLRETPFTCEYDLETTWVLPPAPGANIEGRHHLFAASLSPQDLEYFHRSFSVAGKEGAKIGITTTTLYIDSEKVVECYRSAKQPTPSIAVYPFSRARIPRTAPLSMMEFPLSETIGRYKAVDARVEKGQIILDLFYEETRPKPDKIICLDPRTGYRPKEILYYSETGQLVVEKKFTQWIEIEKDVFLPGEITCRVDVPTDHLLRIEKLQMGNIWFGNKFDPGIFFPDFPSGCMVWDYRFEKGYKIDSSGQLKSPEELLSTN